MRDTNEEYWDVVKGAIGVLIVFAIFIIFLLTGCKTVRSLKKSTTDSTSVSKVNEGSSKTDSSGSKSDKTTTKETVYYPQPIYIEAKNGESKIVFVPHSVKETGTEKTEQFDYSRDEKIFSKLDSLIKAVTNVQSASSTKVGFSTFEIIMMIAGGIIVLKMFTPSIIKLITKT